MCAERKRVKRGRWRLTTLVSILGDGFLVAIYDPFVSLLNRDANLQEHLILNSYHSCEIADSPLISWKFKPIPV